MSEMEYDPTEEELEEEHQVETEASTEANNRADAKSITMSRLSRLKELSTRPEDDLSNDQRNEKKRIIRLEKNRRAAAMSRRKKKMYIKNLEERAALMAKHLAILEMENNQLKAMLSQQNGGTIPTLPPPPRDLPPSSFASMLPPLPDIDGCDEDFDDDDFDDDDNQSQNYNQKNNRNNNNNNHHKTSSRTSKKRKLNNGASIRTNDELSIPMKNMNNNINMISSNDSSISPQYNQFIPKQYSSTNSQDENDATEESSLIIPNNHLKWALPEMSQTEDFKPENGNMKLSSSLPPPPPLIPMMGNIPHQIGQPPMSIHHNRLPPQISNSSSLPSHSHSHPHHLSHPHLHNHNPHAHPQAFQFLHGLPPFMHNIHAQQQQHQHQQQHQQQHGNIPPNVNLNNMNVNIHGPVPIPHNVNIPLHEGFQHANLPPFIMPTHNGQIPQSSQIMIKPENINEHQRIMFPPFMNNNNNNNNNGIMTPLNHNHNININMNHGNINHNNNNNGNEDIKNDNTQ